MNVLIAGDFVPRRRTAAQIEKGDYSCLDEVKPIIQGVDYAIVNFESPVVMREAQPIDKTGPNLHCTEKAMECVAQAGFKCVTLANNHFRDFGQIGVEDTIDACGKYHIDYVGGGRTLANASRVLYKEINGQILAIVNCCEHEWSISTSGYGGSNPLDIVAISQSIKEARRQANYVLVIVHGGTEGYNLPTPRMKSTYRFFVEQGADAVVNHHQHCYSGYEVYQGKPIFYGLGNFCFDKPVARNDKLWEEGYLVELQLTEEIGFRLFPYMQCTEEHPKVELKTDMSEFNDSLYRLNSIIANDKDLEKQFEILALRGISMAHQILSPYSSKLMQRLYTKKLLPSFVTNKRIKSLLAHIQCEAHRDILMFGLNKDLKL